MGVLRRCQVTQLVSTFLASPFVLGIVIGLILNFSLDHHYQGAEEIKFEENPDNTLIPDGNLVVEENHPVLKVEDVVEPKKEEEEKKDKIFVRPRFVKEELNITRKLLVVVLPESSWAEDVAMKKFYNLTLQPHISDVTFMEKPASGKTDILDIVKRLADGQLAGYQLYYIVPDTALVLARNLKQVTEPLVTSRPVFSGQVTEAESGVCQLEAGLLLSRPLVDSMLADMEWCYRNKISYDQSLNLQNCIFHSSKVKCTSVEGAGVRYQAMAQQRATSSHSLSVYGINSVSSMKMMMQNVKLEEIKHYDDQLSKLEDELYSLINTSKYDLPTSWPLGSVMNFQSWDRFDMGIYHHFNQTHQFFEDDYESAGLLGERQAEEVSSLLAQCNLQAEDFSAGWSRLDATRGSDITLEVSHKANDRKLSSRKCQLVKELANPEIVQMPFVTESFKISLIIPVQEKDSQKTMTLLRSFAKNSIEKNDRIFLMLVFLYSPERPDKNNNNDFFKEVKQLALQISKKYKKDGSKSSSHLLWYSMQTKGVTPSDMELMDLVTQKLDNKTIILLGGPDMEIKGDYFNRVRMNTIQNKQVFCPIPFTEYHPAIVYGDRRPPASLAFNTTAGHFDPLNTDHVSFYKSDYLAARQLTGIQLRKHESELRDGSETAGAEAGGEQDLCQLLRRVSSLHALRAPDPSLMLRYEEVTCPADVENERCQIRKQRSFARRKTLATMVLDREQRGET